MPASPGLSPGLGNSAGAWPLPFGAFSAPWEHTGLGVSFRLSVCLSSCQLLYHFWWRFIVRAKVQHASLGEENAILPHDTSPCETGFLLHKETVPHFSCRLILILQTLTRGRGAGSCKWLWLEMKYLLLWGEPGGTSTLGSCWLPEERADFSRKAKSFHAPAPNEFPYSFISAGFQHNCFDALSPGCIGSFGNRTASC